MKNKIIIMTAIVWFCIGGLVTTFITGLILDKYVIEDYQKAIMECQLSK